MGDPTGGALSAEEAYPGFVQDVDVADETTTEAPGQAAPAPATPAAPAGTPAPAQPRDATGRFQPKPEGQPPAPSEPGTQPGQQATPADATGAPPPAGEGAAPAPDYPPWTIRADRQEVPIPGSQWGETGVFIPNEAMQNVAQLIAEGVANRGSARQLREQLQAENTQLRAELQTHPEILQARSFNQAMRSLLAKGPEAVQEFLEDFERRAPQLESEAAQAVLRHQNETLQGQLQEVQLEQEADRLRPVMESQLSDVIGHFAQQPQFAGVNAQAIYERAADPRYAEHIFYEAGPADRPMGLQPGELLLGQGPDGTLYLMNWGLIQDEFGYQAAMLGPRSGATPAAASAHNAATLGGPHGHAPTAIPAAGSPPPLSEETIPPEVLKDKKKAEAWIASKAWRRLPTS